MFLRKMNHLAMIRVFKNKTKSKPAISKSSKENKNTKEKDEIIEQSKSAHASNDGQLLHCKGAIDSYVMTICNNICNSLKNITKERLSKIYKLNPLKEFKIFMKNNLNLDYYNKLLKKVSDTIKNKDIKKTYCDRFQQDCDQFNVFLQRFINKQNPIYLREGITSNETKMINAYLNIFPSCDTLFNFKEISSISQEIECTEVGISLLNQLKAVSSKKKLESDIISLISNYCRNFVTSLNKLKIKQLYIEIVKVNLWCDEKLHRRFLFCDCPVIDEKSLTDKYLGKPLYLSEEFSKRYEKFLNDSLSVLKITTTQIGLEVLLHCELLQITPFDLSLSEISNEIIEENINKEECTFYNNVSSDIPINIKEKHLFEYDPNNDRIEEKISLYHILCQILKKRSKE